MSEDGRVPEARGRRAGRSSRTGSTRPSTAPAWLPDPLTGQIGGRWNNINSVSPDRSYLEGFVWQEIGQEIHINLRGYPGVTKVPTCRSVELVGGKKVVDGGPVLADSPRPEDDRPGHG